MLYLLRRLLPAIFAVIFAISAISTRADTNAVTLLSSDGVGFVTGAIGFSFVPATNLNVTSVGYHDGGAADPIITLWSGTNFAFATYSLPPGSGSGLLVTTNVAVTLLAGHPYTITVQDGPLSSNQAIELDFSSAPHFVVAPDVANFSSKRVNPSGGFGDQGTNTFYFGADFTYTTTSFVSASPHLTIALTNAASVVVSWPNAPGFVLEANLDLTTTNWFVVTNTVNSANGTNWVVDSALNSQKFYRLFYP